MKLSESNFFKNEHGTRYFVYGYESENKMYDIYIDKLGVGEKPAEYMVNMSPSARTKTHDAIIKHFGLAL